MQIGEYGRKNLYIIADCTGPGKNGFKFHVAPGPRSEIVRIAL